MLYRRGGGGGDNSIVMDNYPPIGLVIHRCRVSRPDVRRPAEREMIAPPAQRCVSDSGFRNLFSIRARRMARAFSPSYSTSARRVIIHRGNRIRRRSSFFACSADFKFVSPAQARGVWIYGVITTRGKNLNDSWEIALGGGGYCGGNRLGSVIEISWIILLL